MKRELKIWQENNNKGEKKMTAKHLYKFGNRVGLVTSTDDHYIYATINGKSHKIWRWDVNYIDGAYHLNYDSTLKV